MGMPNDKRLKEIRKRLEYAEGTKALPKNPTALEKFRWDIQQSLVSYKLTKGCTQKEMAEKAEIDEAKMSKILHHRLEGFSTDRLITIYSKINPKIKLRVS